MKTTRLALLLAAAFILPACESPEPAAPVPAGAADAAPEQAVSMAQLLDEALAGDHRSTDNKARDQYRHPAETLTFFGVQPDHTVIEIWPGGGWYTEILAPYLKDNGRYIAAGWDPESEIPFIRDGVAAFQARLDANPEVYGNTEVTVLMPPAKLQMVEPGTVDVVLTFRSIHNWMPRNSQDMILASVYEALKPGGILGVVEHRGDAAVEQDPQAKTGYVNEAYAIEMIEKAGFVFEDSSEINANPADTKDYPEGVWTLPPTLRLGEQDRDKYIAIGESDRFTLKFRKPAE